MQNTFLCHFFQNLVIRFFFKKKIIVTIDTFQISNAFRVSPNFENTQVDLRNYFFKGISSKLMISKIDFT